MICTEDAGDLLLGGDVTLSLEVNQLYLSSVDAPPANTASIATGFSHCGHTEYGTTWANDGTWGCAYDLTHAPTECSDATLGSLQGVHD